MGDEKFFEEIGNTFSDVFEEILKEKGKVSVDELLAKESERHKNEVETIRKQLEATEKAFEDYKARIKTSVEVHLRDEHIELFALYGNQTIATVELTDYDAIDLAVKLLNLAKEIR